MVLYVLRAQDADPGVQRLALESMRYSRNYSVTSVQFLRGLVCSQGYLVTLVLCYVMLGLHMNFNVSVKILLTDKCHVV
jgi:hypothetical protein